MSLLSLRHRFLIAFSLVGALAVGVAGCGSGGPKLYPVSGKVMLGKEPLKAGMVTYFPDEAKGNKSKNSPTGEIQSDGSYKLSTSGKPGAPAGWYKIMVTTSTPGMGGATTPDPNNPQVASLNPQGSGPQVNDKYKSVSTTDLAKEVVPSGGAYDLEVSP